MTRLRSAAEADSSLARAETQAGRFASAVKILDQASERTQEQPELRDLHARLQAQRGRAFRVAEFYRLLHETWHLSFREHDLQAVAAAEHGLRVLEIFEQPRWWQALPGEDLTAAQQEQLRQDTYEMFHLLAALRTKLGMINFLHPKAAKEHYEAALALVERIQAYQPSQTIRLIKVISLAMLGKIDQVRPMPPAELTHPTDQFFFGMIQFFVGVQPDNFLVRALFQAVTRHVPALDLEDPKAKGKQLLQMAITQQPSHFGYYIWLGLVLMAEKDLAGSELAFNSAVAVRPDEYWTYGFRPGPGDAGAVGHRTRGAPPPGAAALWNLDRAIELEPGESINYWFKADMHAWLQQRAEAVEAMSRFFETVRPPRLTAEWPDSTGLFGGSVAAQRQNIENGLVYIQQSLEKSPRIRPRAGLWRWASSRRTSRTPRWPRRKRC